MDTIEQKVAVDLSGTLPVDTAVLYTVIPGTNKRSGWDIVMAGPGHAKTIALNSENERKRLLLEQRIESARINSRKWKPEDKQADESRREFVESLVARIVSWTPVNFGDGPVEFSEKAAVTLLLSPRLGGYVTQIVDFLIDERTFMKDSANN